MSPVYRMIHGLDDEKPRAPRMPAQSVQNNHKPSAEPREDEKTFTGLNRTEIPSKSFQRLQQYTDQNSIDTTSIRHPNPEDGDAIGDYSQASIRYMGRNIPSKSFRMLQNLTGGPDNTPIPPPQRRARKPVQPPVQESNPDDVVDIAYVGSDIPSKSFRMLQNSVGESAGSDTGRDEDRPYERNDEYRKMQYSGAGVPGENQLIASRSNSRGTLGKSQDSLLDSQGVQRRRRPRQAPPKPPHVDATTHDTSPRAPRATIETNIDEDLEEFDETAYLAGKVEVLGNSTEKKMPRSQSYQPEQAVPWQTADYERSEQTDNFDESAYLDGKVAVFGDQPRISGQKDKKSDEDLPEWQVKRNSGLFESMGNFDEDSFLSSKGWRRWDVIPKEKAPWEDCRQTSPSNKQHNETFDESEYLTGNIPITKRPTVKPFPARAPIERESAPWVQQIQERRSTYISEEFDESAYLSGSLSRTHRRKPRLLPESQEDTPEWKAKLEQRNSVPDELYNELAYLKGCIPVVKGGPVDMSSIANSTLNESMIERDLEEDVPPPNNEHFDEEKFLGRTAQHINLNSGEIKPATETPTWQKRADLKIDGDKYDENKFLQGGIQTVGPVIDRKLTPRQQFFRVEPVRQKASWEKDTTDNGETGVISTPQYNGTLPNTKNNVMRSGDNNRMSNKHFTVIKRSGSTTSDSMSSYCESDRMDSDADKAYNDMMYVGKKIPSKTFLKLQQSVNSHKTTAQEYHDRRVRRRSRSEDEGIDISSDVTDKVDVGHASSQPNHAPQKDTMEPVQETLPKSEVKPYSHRGTLVVYHRGALSQR